MTITKPFHPLYCSTFLAITALFLAVGEVTADTIVQEAYLKASNADGADGESDSFGHSAALDGDTLVVGAPFEDSSARGVNGAQSDNSSPGAGAAYVFVRDGSGSWAQQAYLKASNTDAGDRFGHSLALDGDTLVIGAPFEGSSASGLNGIQSDNSSSQAGAAYVFVRDGSGTWSQQAYLKASNTDSIDRFGWSVALDGDTLVVGAQFEGSSARGVNGAQSDNSSLGAGAVYVFARDGSGTWSQQTYLKASNTDRLDRFGHSVALDGDTLVVGACKEDSGAPDALGDPSDNSSEDAGAAYVFVRDGSGTWSQQAYLKASNTDVADQFGTSVSLDGDRLVVGASGEGSSARGVNGDQGDNSSSAAGAAYVFERDGSGTWSQQAYLKASNTDLSDQFGQTVALDGDTLVVGASGEDSSARGVDGDESDNSSPDAGAAYVFVRDGSGTWSQQAYIKSSNMDAGDRFASTNYRSFFNVSSSVALEGDALAVGAPSEDSSATGISGDQSDNSSGAAGAAYVFVRDGSGTWSQQAYLKASNTDARGGDRDQFGRSLALDGDTLVVGAQFEGSGGRGVNGDQSDNSAPAAGAAYVFVRDGSGAWSQQAYLKASNTDEGDQFGRTVALDGDTLLVGAPYEDSSARGINGDESDNSAGSAGAAYVFVRDGSGTWSQQAYLKASNTDAGDRFGSSVALDGDTLVVGASGEDSSARGVDGDQSDNSSDRAGAAYVFVRDGSGAWIQQAYLKASNTDARDSFGESVGLDGDTLVVGAFNEDSRARGVNGDQSDNSSIAAGAAYVFVRDGSGTWSQQAYLKASNTETFEYFTDQFGQTVTLDGNTLVVGAPFENSNARGVNGNQGNTSSATGAAYVFVRDGSGTWSQQAYLKASNTDRGDRFAWSVALDGDRLVIGAILEESNARGINGNQSDNSSAQAGAAYVFVRDGSGAWSQQAYIKASNTEEGDVFGISLALDGDMLVVGAYREDSSARGVNGDQSDNSSEDAGAAYVFNLSASPKILAIDQIGGEVEISYHGILQKSADLLDWTDLDPQPTSPYRFTPSLLREYYRAREE